MYPPSIYAAMRKPSFWLHTSTAVFFFFLTLFLLFILSSFWPSHADQLGVAHSDSPVLCEPGNLCTKIIIIKKRNTAQPSSEPWHPDLNTYIYIYKIYNLRQFLFPSNVWTPHKISQKLTVKQKQKRTNKQNKKKQIISISTIQYLVIIILFCYGRISSRIIVYVLFYAWSHRCLEVSGSGAEVS